MLPKRSLNFRIHLFATGLALLLGYFLHISTDEWLWIALCVTIVLVTELFNTMIEALVDFVSPGFNETAGRVKDMSAGAVVDSRRICFAYRHRYFFTKAIATVFPCCIKPAE